MLQLLDELATWNPWRDLDRFQWDFNKFPENFSWLGGANRAPVNIYGNENALKVVVRIPGWQADWFDLSVEGNRLFLKGETRNEAGDAPYLKVNRVVKLPYRVQTDKVKASYENGILTVDLNRHEQDKPKKIGVQAA